jgi:hypothetical protein
MMGDTRTAKDGFVGSGSLIRLAWTEWSVHHLEREGGREGEARTTSPTARRV